MSWRNKRKGALEVLPLLHKHKEILIFDVETTGLNPQKNKIIQFSAIKYEIQDDLTLKPIYEIDQYINPKEPLSEKIIGITGITDNMLEPWGDEEQYVCSIMGLLDSVPLWGGYNVNFDINMLEGMSERNGLPFFRRDTIDILDMARNCVPHELMGKDGNYKLSTITNYLFPNNKISFHSAIEDVAATGKVMEVFMRLYADALAEKKELVQVHLEWASYWENPNMKSMQRIKVNIDPDKSRYGWIYWDVLKKCWSCKKDKRAEELFDTVDMENLESQVMRKYAWKYNASTMDELAKAWGKDKRTKKKSE